MNKFLVFALIFVLLLGLCSCDSNAADFNESINLGNYGYYRCHVFPSNTCLPVSKWTDSEIGAEIYHESYGWLYLSEGTYVLCSDVCPFCD